MCGGTPVPLGRRLPPEGLSPRVRGNQHIDPHDHPAIWSIPACAGEPAGVPMRGLGRRVYPRVCGGTLRDTIHIRPTWGLSPRVRGNPHPSRQRQKCQRSIPACAGEPPFVGGTSYANRVYPRVCGGTGACQSACACACGLSPRVRGNPRRGWRDGGRLRSIPACAGEPCGSGFMVSPPQVYPRVCGGTQPVVNTNRKSQGLSPRVRGNP